MPCELCGHQAVLDKIRNVLGIEPGETTEVQGRGPHAQQMTLNPRQLP